MIPLRHVYRRLVRAAAPATRFSRPATRSVRQLLRADVEALARACGGLDAHIDAQHAVNAEHTMALYLYSSVYFRPVHGPDPEHAAPTWRPDSESHAAKIAHRAVANMASLAYHQLSPNTPMRRTRVGGSRASNEPHRRTAIEHALAFEDGMDAVDVDAAAAASKVGVLQVAPKPVRGPVGARPRLWDGQQPGTHAPQMDAHAVHSLQAYVDEVGRAYVAAREAGDAGAEELRQRLVDARGTLKGLRRKHEQHAAQHELLERPIRALDDVVQLACASEALWLGAARWAMRRRGAFLPP